MQRGRWLAVVAALLLAGCGAAGPCAPGASPRAVVLSVPTLQHVGNYWGLTEFGCGGEPTVVQISEETPDSLVSRVIAHELLHVAGLVHHEEDPACYLHESIYPAQTHVPCAEELDRLLTATGTYEVEVLSEELVARTRAAADMWNDYAGRVVFTVVDASAPVPVAP